MLENHMVLHLNEHLDRMFPSLEQQQAEQERIQEKADEIAQNADFNFICECFSNNSDQFEKKVTAAIHDDDAIEFLRLVKNAMRDWAKGEAELMANKGEL